MAKFYFRLNVEDFCLQNMSPNGLLGRPFEDSSKQNLFPSVLYHNCIAKPAGSPDISSNQMPF